VTLRCILDGLLLPACLHGEKHPPLLAWDGDESFGVEALEALYYEVVSATTEELLGLEAAHYRLLRRAWDFQVEDGVTKSVGNPCRCSGGLL
jgi:hypothetical protein